MLDTVIPQDIVTHIAEPWRPHEWADYEPRLTEDVIKFLESKGWYMMNKNTEVMVNGTIVTLQLTYLRRYLPSYMFTRYAPDGINAARVNINTLLSALKEYADVAKRAKAARGLFDLPGGIPGLNEDVESVVASYLTGRKGSVAQQKAQIRAEMIGKKGGTRKRKMRGKKTRKSTRRRV